MISQPESPDLAWRRKPAHGEINCIYLGSLTEVGGCRGLVKSAEIAILTLEDHPPKRISVVYFVLFKIGFTLTENYRYSIAFDV